MLDIKKWERKDIIYAILSMSISAVIVSVVLIQQNGLFAKTIMFAIISVLIYFVLKYIQEHRRKVNKKSVYKSEVSIKASNKEKIVEDLDSDKKKSVGEEEEESKIEHFDRMGSEHRPIKRHKHHRTGRHNRNTRHNHHHHDVHPTTHKLGDDNELVHHDDHHHPIYRDTKQDFLLGEEEHPHHEEEQHPHHEEEQHPHHEEEQHPHHEEEQHPHHEEEQHPHHEEEQHPHGASSKSLSLDNTNPSGNPININISYNTRNSTNTDDIISIKERFGKPDQSDHIFNTPKPETINMKMNTNVQNKLKNNNQLLSQNNSNNKYYSPPDSRCHGSACSPQPPRKEKVYSGHNYEYMNPDIPPNNFENCISNRKNHDVCPLSINQNWSKWNPQYLSGDDSNSNMVN